MTKLSFWIGLFLLTASFVQAQSSYGDNRSRADTDSRTMEARRRFSLIINQKFASLRNQYRLNNIRLTFNQRMIAQYGRGASTAFEVIPDELEQVSNFIFEARNNRIELLEDLTRNYRTLRNYSKSDINEAIGLLASTRKIHLDFWGYFSSYIAPDFDLEDKKLIYFAHWHEADSYYELYSERQMRSNIIRGIIAKMNYSPWYRQIFN